jgi:hypothetical protein
VSVATRGGGGEDLCRAIFIYLQAKAKSWRRRILIKVMVTLEQATKTQRGSRCVTLLFL